MVGLNQAEGRYRVLLIGIGDNTEEENGSFCRNLSESYSVPFSFLRKIVDTSPVILNKMFLSRKRMPLRGHSGPSGQGSWLKREEIFLPFLSNFRN